MKLIKLAHSEKVLSSHVHERLDMHIKKRVQNAHAQVPRKSTCLLLAKKGHVATKLKKYEYNNINLSLIIIKHGLTLSGSPS